MALTKTQVSQLYVSLFGRASEGAGNTYWQTQNAANADTNINRTNTATEMLNLAVVKTYFGVTDYATTANVQTVVEAIYLNTLGKTYAQDTVGVDYWVAAVAGGTSMGSMVNSLIIAINAPANRVAAADIAASNTFNNKVSVSDYTADNLSALTTTTIFTAYLTGVTDAASTVVTAKAAALADVPVVANPGTTFTLTTGSDNLTGSSADDTFMAGEGAAAATTLSAGDVINGGAGVDNLRYVETDDITALPIGLSITNVETFTVIGGGAITLDTTAIAFNDVNVANSGSAGILTAAATTNVTYTLSAAAAVNATINGGKNVSATSLEAAAGTSIVGNITAATGTVAVTQGHIYADTADYITGAIAITGGTVITSTQSANFTAADKALHLADASNNTITAGSVTITGNASTTSVTTVQDAAITAVDIAQSGIVGYANSAVIVADVNQASTTVASTITSVSVTGGAVVTVESGALETLSLGGTITSVDADSLGSLTTAAVTTLTLNLNGAISTGAVVIDTDITAMTLNGNTTKSTLADLDIDGVVTLTVGGDALIVLTAQKDAALTTITSTSTGGIQLGTALATTVAVTTGAGADSVLIGATTKAISLGGGNDTVTISSGTVGTGGSVDGGAGTGDKLIMTNALAAAADGSSVFNGSFTNFEVLQLSDAMTEDALDLEALNDVSTVILARGATTATINNLNTNGTVEFITTDSTGVTTINVDGAVTRTTDILNLKISNSADVYALATVTAANVETINISAADFIATGSVAAINTMIGTFASATTINVSGNNGLALTATGSVLVTTFDASGVVDNNTLIRAGLAATIDSTTNLAVTYVSLNTTANAVVTITGGEGNDTLTGSAGAVNLDTISGGEGADIIKGGTGEDILTGGAGADIIKGGLASDTINLAETTQVKDIVVLSSGLTADVINDFADSGGTAAAKDEIQLDLSDLETAGAVVAGKTMSIDTLVDGTTQVSAGQATVQEVVDQAAGAAVAASAGSDVYILLTETYASLAALETGIETGDHELTVHGNAAVNDLFFVVYSDGTDAHVVAMSIAVDGGANFADGNLTATNLATLKGHGTIAAGDFAAANFEWIT